jgi:transposase
MLGRWILEQEKKETGSAPGASSGDLKDEVKRLREENRKLKMEREILVKVAAFFAKESI